MRASRRPTSRTAADLSTKWPFLLALSGIQPCKTALPNEPITKARTRFRSHLLDPRSQLDADRFPLKVTAMPCFDATMSELASVITVAAVVFAAASVRGWDHVVVIRVSTSRPQTASSTNGT